MPKKGEAVHGEKRVEVGAKCRNGKHCACTVMDCDCACHAEEIAR